VYSQGGGVDTLKASALLAPVFLHGNLFAAAMVSDCRPAPPVLQKEILSALVKCERNNELRPMKSSAVIKEEICNIKNICQRSCPPGTFSLNHIR
jgi:hypothetical protein